MPSKCCAVGCDKKKGDRDIAFYRLPKEEERRQRWLSAIRRVNWTPTASSHLCSVHFISGAKSQNPLSPDYVPTVFPHLSSPNKQKRIYQMARKTEMEGKNQTQSQTSDCAADVPQRESRFQNPVNNFQRPLSQSHQRELDYLRNQVEDLRARLQKKNQFLTLEKEKRVKAEQESQSNLNQLNSLTSEVEDLRARLQKKNQFLTLEKEKRVKAEQESQSNRNHLNNLTNEVEDLRARLQKKNQFLTLEKEKRVKAEQESQSNLNQLNNLTNEVEDLRARLQKKNQFLTLEKEKRVKAEQESQSNLNQLNNLTNEVEDLRARLQKKNCWKRCVDSDQQREKECRLRRHYEQELTTYKNIVEELGESSKTPNPEGQSELRQAEPQEGNLNELENLKKRLEEENKSNQDLKFKLKSQEEIIHDLEWKVAEITVQLKMATDINDPQILDQVSEPGCPSAESKSEQLSEQSVDSESEAPEPQENSKPQVVSESVDLQPQEVSGPELDSESLSEHQGHSVSQVSETHGTSGISTTGRLNIGCGLQEAKDTILVQTS